MTVRVLFRCSRCGSKRFRVSKLRTFRDTLFLKIGFVPQRCYICRGRFYVISPRLLRRAASALGGLAVPEPLPQTSVEAPSLVWTGMADPQDGL